MIFPEIPSPARAEHVEVSLTGPRVCLTAPPRVLRLRRRLPTPAGKRTWLVELVIDVPRIDPEQLLAECEEYLVDGSDGRPIGVVERVETSDATGEAAVLLVSVGWVGRLRRIDTRAVETLLPDERRVIVDETRMSASRVDGRRS